MGKFDSLLEKIGLVTSVEDEPEEEQDGETYSEPKSSFYSSMRSTRGASDVRLTQSTDTPAVTASASAPQSSYRRARAQTPPEQTPLSPKVVNLHANVQMEVVVSSPESFDEAKAITDDLKNHKPVVINLEMTEHAAAQRITDFLCGACYALGGNIQQIADNIYLIAPGNVDIAATGDFKKTLQTEGGIHFPWKQD